MVSTQEGDRHATMVLKQKLKKWNIETRSTISSIYTHCIWFWSDYIQCFLGFFSVALLVLSSWHQMKQEEPATSPCSRKSWSFFMGFQWDINGFLMDFNARSCDWRIGASRLLGDTVGITNGYNYGDNLQSWDIGLFAPLITAPLSRPSTMPCHKMEVPQMDHNSPWLLVWTHFCSWDTVPILIG